MVLVVWVGVRLALLLPVLMVTLPRVDGGSVLLVRTIFAVGRLIDVHLVRVQVEYFGLRLGAAVGEARAERRNVEIKRADALVRHVQMVRQMFGMHRLEVALVAA